MKTNLLMKFVMLFALTSVLMASSCDIEKTTPTAKSGVKEATVKLETQSNGFTVEQNNIAQRLTEDNSVGSIKHLYVLSAYSGQVILYSTVKGKVTSGGKRLTNTEVLVNGNTSGGYQDYALPNIQDDGTYGSSMDYLYWWDSKGVYHQHYVSGGQILHISSQPIANVKIIINLESK